MHSYVAADGCSRYLSNSKDWKRKKKEVGICKTIPGTAALLIHRYIDADL
jgi:hypothetical protein